MSTQGKVEVVAAPGARLVGIRMRLGDEIALAEFGEEDLLKFIAALEYARGIAFGSLLAPKEPIQ